MASATPLAPDLPGFTPLRFLGSGGFAEVHLYEQTMPRREVAVKILSTTIRGSSTAEAFEAEANLMASVSTHPAIVTIHQADISPDGHPFIVMEHCPRPNLQQRVRGGRTPVPDVLRIGIQLAGAVETAHRAGILHRDIKPANVLFTQYDRPALTDFGIANTLAGPSTSDVGLSIPWAPVEAFDGVGSGVRLDVYSLGATFYGMLAGHAPFHIPGGANGQREQIERIRHAVLPPIARQDVPASLARVVARALSRDPDQRQQSALALGQDLQRIQAELGLVHTPMDVFDAVEDDGEQAADDDQPTRIRLVPRADLDDLPTPVVPPDEDPDEVRGSTVVPDTVRIIREQDLPQAPAPASRPRKGPPALLLASIGVVAAIAGVVLLVAPWGPAPVRAGRTAAAAGGLEVTAEPDGDRVIFSWTDPDAEDGQSYSVTTTDADGTADEQVVVGTILGVDAAASGRTCIEVRVVRGDVESAPTKKCT